MSQADDSIRAPACVILTLHYLILLPAPTLSARHSNTSHPHHHTGTNNGSSWSGSSGNNTYHTGMQTKQWTVRDLASCLLQHSTLQSAASSSSSMSVEVHGNQSSLQNALHTLLANYSTNVSTSDPQASSSCRLKVKVRPGGHAKVNFPGWKRSVCGVVMNSGAGMHTAARVLATRCRDAQTAVSLDGERHSGWYSLQVTVRWNSSFSSGGIKEGGLLTIHVTGDVGVYFTSTWQGYIQRQNWPGTRVLGQKWVKLNVPPNRNTLISLRDQRAKYPRQTFTCTYADRIRIYVTGNDSYPRFFSCRGDTFAPLLSEKETVYVEFPPHRRGSRNTERSWQLSVRLLFTFVPKSSGLRLLPGGRWNCTVEEWGEVRRHFPCKLQRECEGGEDEEGCPHLGSCGDGIISLESGCYAFFGGQNISNWVDSDKACADLGGTLASLNTAQEWTEVTELLRDYPHTVETFLGLRRASPGLHRMYRQSYRWNDGTIAHWVVLTHSPRGRADSHQSKRPPMGKAFVFSKNTLGSGWNTFMPLSPLGQDKRRSYLCEVRPPTLAAGRPSDSVNESSVVPGPDSSNSSTRSSDPTPARSAQRIPRPTVKAAYRNSTTYSSSLVICPRGHLVFTTDACEPDCRVDPNGDHPLPRPPSPLSPFSPPLSHSRLRRCGFWGLDLHPPVWQCGCGGRRVAYADLCDGKADCSDGSDEEFCVFPPCRHFVCVKSHRCIPQTAVCDNRQDCLDGSDEDQCNGHGEGLSRFFPRPNQSVFVELDWRGYLLSRNLGNVSCPQTHFRCHSNPDLCLPVFLLCNGVPDCPSGEDESDCDTYSCLGFYRCRRSRTCVDLTSLCDDKFQCPEGDDERGCGVQCPAGCTCFDQIYFCGVRFQVDRSPSPALRYLDATGSGMRLSDLAHESMVMLYHLVLARCRLMTLDRVPLPNLYLLDLSSNRLMELNPLVLQQFRNLHVLSLAANPLRFLASSIPGYMSTWKRLSVHSLDLSGVWIHELQDDALYALGLTDLQFLNLSFCGMQRVGRAFQKLPLLQTLDVRGSYMAQIPQDIFEGLHMLEHVFADNYKLCCPATLPEGFNQLNCHAPLDEFSSCQDLLRSNMNRFFLYFYTLLAILGNVGSLVYHFCDRRNRRDSSSSCNVFVSHLCVSDLLMGVFLLLIGVADFQYRGHYVWNDEKWRYSVMCRAAGFLAMLSCEVSALIICLITVDRLIALRFPLRHLRFKAWSAHLTCMALWLVGLTLAGVPLLPATAHWEFYSQTGVCIPLPITRMDFRGRTYSFGILIVFNFLLFLIIGPGQVLIYRAVRRHQRASSNTNSSASSENAALASRLFTIAMTDFLCWFPVGCLGLLAANGFPIPGEFNVVTVIFVLPVNSALNPFIYTLGMHVERQRQRQKRCTCGHATTQAETNVDDAPASTVAYIPSTLDVA